MGGILNKIAKSCAAIINFLPFSELWHIWTYMLAKQIQSEIKHDIELEMLSTPQNNPHHYFSGYDKEYFDNFC